LGKYPPEIRTLVYTTNPIESLNRKITKVAKNKAIFPNDQALIKQVYLAVEEAAKKWTFRHRDWAMIYSQLMIYFGDRLGERAQMQKRSSHRISDTPAPGIWVLDTCPGPDYALFVMGGVDSEPEAGDPAPREKRNFLFVACGTALAGRFS